jgi:DNA polymerase
MREAETDPRIWRQRALDGSADLEQLRQASRHCRGCDLWQRATQTVFGEGPKQSAEDGPMVVLVGEQPGDQEDRAGRPFVGRAGRLLDEALAEAGLDRTRVYVTNAVKHFRWKSRGKRRIHEKPAANEVRACRAWLDAELALLDPEVVVLLGATAAQALLGSGFRVTRERGVLLQAPFARHVLATVHPSSLLRMPDASARQRERERFVADLRQVALLLG